MAVRDLVGVLEEGSALSPEVPGNARVTLRMTQGSTLVVRLAVVTLAGVPVDLAVGPATVNLTVKRRSDGAAVLNVVGVLLPISGPNCATFSLSASATKYVDPGRYVYDVWMVHPGGRDAIVPMSPFVLEPGLQLP